MIARLGMLRQAEADAARWSAAARRCLDACMAMQPGKQRTKFLRLAGQYQRWAYWDARNARRIRAALTGIGQQEGMA